MRKLYLLLPILFLIYWGCEETTEEETTPTEVTLWGEVYSVEDTDSLDLSNNQLTGEIPESICDLNIITTFIIDWGSWVFNISNNQLCPPYPSCIENYVGEQDTSDCD